MVKYSQAMEHDCTGCLLNILSAFSVQMRGTRVYKEMVPLQSKEDLCLILSLTSAAEEIPFLLVKPPGYLWSIRKCVLPVVLGSFFPSTYFSVLRCTICLL